MGTVSLGTYKERARTWGKPEGRQSMNRESENGLDRLFQLSSLLLESFALNALVSTISSGNVGSHDLIHRLAHKHLPPTMS